MINPKAMTTERKTTGGNFRATRAPKYPPTKLEPASRPASTHTT